MVLCIDLGDACLGDNLPEPIVFAAGANRRYVVLARHPRCGYGINKDVTEYYYIIRTPAEGGGIDAANVKGPYALDRFNKKKRRLGLPDFSVELRDLK